MNMHQKSPGFYRTSFSQSSTMIPDEKVQAFIDHLTHSDSSALDAFKLTLDGRELTEEEAKRFIAFIRSEMNAMTNLPQR
ncbi:hypothetical protein [Cohnella kolymensis]|uniref:hypothetical protein n=1 Tax=Cohnella kolymensis TaxID=1590652 RepID=UPI000695EE9D|nr:hypothetical protein [Cohnella kolymensis]